MKIAHVSDLHIRNFKYRAEYKAAFEELYDKLRELKPDLIINTGDTVHSKLAVSPELFDDVANHFLSMSSIAPHWVILGNHDLNLKNSNRMDAISPIISALQGRTKHELRLCTPGCNLVSPSAFQNYRIYSYDIRGHNKLIIDPAHINIGLYHGSISGCVTDIGFVMEDGEAEVDKFDDMDFVLLGDIHKRQSFRDGRVQYPGSLIQQNYGEELVKGFLLWDIQSKDSFTVDFHEIKNVPGRFHTVKIPSSLDLTGIDIPSGSRIRAMVDGELSPSKRWELEQALTEKYSPIEVITPDSSGEKASLEVMKIDDLVGSREQLMRDHLKERNITDDDADDVVSLFLDYEKGLDLDGSARGTTWQLRRVSWDNMMNYGEGNVIDLTKLKGLVGVFAPNASGKSSIFDIMLQSLFDKVTKDVPRNIDLVNDNKDSGCMNVELESNGQPFSIERTIERIQYGQRKLAEAKQWGKTSLDFSSVDESLNGTSRPETEKIIRGIIGSFEDFALTTMVSQNPLFGLPGGGDIINCRETDRRKILFRFLDLDVYEKVNQSCKEELKTILNGIKGQDHDTVSSKIEEIEVTLLASNVTLTECRADQQNCEELLDSKKQDLSKLEADDRAQDARDIIKLEDAATIANKKLRAAEDALLTAKRKLGEAEDKLSALGECPKRPDISLDDLASQMDDVVSKREAARIGLSNQKDSLSRGKKALITLEDVPCEGKFPSCKFIKEASEFLTQKEIIESALETFKSEADEATDKMNLLSQYKVIHSGVANWERNFAELSLSVKQLASNVNHQNDARLNAFSLWEAADSALNHARETFDPTIGQQIAGIRLEIEKCKSSLTDVKRRTESVIKNIGAFDSKKSSLDKELIRLNEMRQKVAVYERLVELTGKNGLPYRILTLVLPIINEEISKILSGVVKFNIFFEDNPEEQTVSLSIRYGDYRSRPLSLGSGAEKFIASLAIRVALLSVSSLPKTDILIIDEGFGKLDPEHLEALQRMFEYLKDAFGTVFIVSHVDSMRDIVDHSLEITSLDGYAHVEAT